MIQRHRDDLTNAAFRAIITFYNYILISVRCRVTLVTRTHC